MRKPKIFMPALSVKKYKGQQGHLPMKTVNYIDAKGCHNMLNVAAIKETISGWRSFTATAPKSAAATSCKKTLSNIGIVLVHAMFLGNEFEPRVHRVT